MQTFVFTGLTGAGKSSFINSVFGVEVAPVDQFRACTKRVQAYRCQAPNGDLCLIDTPGLREDAEELDRQYLNSVKTVMRTEDITATFYITKITETRLTRDERQGLRLITEVLGCGFWRSASLVLTFCAAIRPDLLELTYNARLGHIRSAVNECGIADNFQTIILCDNVESNWTKPHAWPLNSDRVWREPTIRTFDSAADHDAIARLAYFYWEDRGRTNGSPEEDWFRARREIWSRRLSICSSMELIQDHYYGQNSRDAQTE